MMVRHEGSYIYGLMNFTSLCEGFFSVCGQQELGQTMKILKVSLIDLPPEIFYRQFSLK